MESLSSARAYSLLKHVIWESLHTIHVYTNGLTQEEFARNRLVQDALVRHLDIINRTVHKIPPDFRTRYPKIQWERLDTLKQDLIPSLNMGVSHTSWGWQVLREQLPRIREQILQAIEEYQRTPLNLK